MNGYDDGGGAKRQRIELKPKLILTSIRSSSSSSCPRRNPPKMPPIDLLMQMSCATDVEDFLKFIDQSSIDAKVNIGTWWWWPPAIGL